MLPSIEEDDGKFCEPECYSLRQLRDVGDLCVF